MFWKNFSRQFGPGIIMASSCVGGSHIIASTQAGAYYGYQLAFFILLVNLLKYPFFRIAFDYSSVNNRTLLEGYAGKGSPLSLSVFGFQFFRHHHQYCRWDAAFRRIAWNVATI